MDVEEGLPGSAILLRDQVHRLFDDLVVQTALQEIDDKTAMTTVGTNLW